MLVVTQLVMMSFIVAKKNDSFGAALFLNDEKPCKRHCR